MNKNLNAYLGHPAAGGGIQLHSIGESFPWDVIAYGDLNPVQWRACNHNTSQLGPIRSTIAQATADVREYVERAKIVAAIQRRGIVNWADVACDPCPVPANVPFASQQTRNDAITVVVEVYYVDRFGVASDNLARGWDCVEAGLERDDRSHAERVVVDWCDANDARLAQEGARNAVNAHAIFLRSQHGLPALGR